MSLPLGLALLVSLTAAPRQNPHLPRAVEQLQAFDAEGAQKTLELAKRWPYNTERELAEVNLYLGWAYAEMGKEDGTLESFRLARLLDPEVKLPADASPKLFELWVASGGTVARATTPPADAPMEDLAPPTAPSSVALPPVAPVGGLSADPATPRPRRWVLPSVVADGAMVLLTTALVVGTRSMNNLSRSGTEPNVVSAQALHSRAKSEATTANVLFGCAGALGAASVVFFFTF
jgi:hypothetical protein